MLWHWKKYQFLYNESVNVGNALMDRDKIVIKDLVDFSEFQKLMDSFYSLTGIPIGVIDPENNILVATGWQDICTKYHRCHPETLKNCLESDKYFVDNLAQNSYVAYKCKNNLWDIAKPIFIEEQHVATIFLGQFHYSDEIVDEDFFYEQAEKYNFDKTEYLSALRKIPRFTREFVDQAIGFYSQLANFLTSSSFANYQLQKELRENESIQRKLRVAMERVGESEQRFRQLAENIDEVFWVRNDHEMLYVNPAFEKIFGIPCQMLYVNPQVFIELIHPEDQSRVNELFQSSRFIEEGLFDYDYRILRPDKTILWINAKSYPIFDESGKILRRVGIATNITEKKQQELKLINAKRITEESELKHRSLFINAPLSYQSLDEDGNIIDLNPMWLKTLGYEREDVIGKWFGDFIHPDFKEHFKTNFPQFKNRGFISDVQFMLRKKNGDFIFVSFEGNVGFTPEGKFKQTYCVFKDITEQKRAEEELLKAKAKAEESDSLKTAFLQNISHEIRTPMNAIAGFAGMLDKPELSEEKRRGFISIIQNSSNQLLSVVADILAISSLETKQEKVNVSAVCISSIIDELLSIFMPQVVSQKVSLLAKQGLPVKESEIYTDKTKLTQILSNLIANALKFTHEGFIEFGYELKVEKGGASILEFFVKDSGIGIRPELQEKIFDRFRQADLSISKKYGGAGLGLSISKGFVELLGGEIRVNSEPEKGSAFYFTIPYKQVMEIDKPDISGCVKGNSKTILVAEDEEFNFFLIEELLSDLDVTLIHAKDGIEVIEMFKKNPEICLILMDIKMPKKDGHAAAKEIKLLCPEVPIIAQSAYALESEIEKYSGNCFDNYITKPINSKKLVELVKGYLK